MKSYYRTRLFFPWMTRALDNKRIGILRKQLLGHVIGKTLEIGFGTGLNLPYYPKEVPSIVAIDPFLSQLTHRPNYPLVELYKMEAENLQFQDSTFDTVVSTFTLCSVKNIDIALHEIFRVLKTGGKLLYLEHGKSWNKYMIPVQNISNPFFQLFAAGCQVNLDIENRLAQQDFQLTHLQHIRYQHHLITGFFYLGMAIKNK